MKGVFIAFDQAHKDAVINALNRLNCRGFSFIEQMQGRGSNTGEPHYGTHAWASMNSGIITMVNDNIVENLLAALKEIDESAEMLGLRAFVWNIEQAY
jgi:nitrogen regulatory protein PII